VKLDGAPALVAGGASGLGAATARELVSRGAHVAIVDLDADRGEALAEELGGATVAYKADVTNEDEVQTAVEGAVEAFGGLRFAVSCAGIGWAERTVGKNGPAQLQPFETVIRVNLIGTFNVLRLAAAAIAKSTPLDHGERGVIINTASVAAFDGQIGQIAYAASKAGVAGMTLPAARDLAPAGIRVLTIAPGIFDTPMLGTLADDRRAALAADVVFPKRLGDPAEYGALVAAIVETGYLNAETIRLDGGIRMPPK